MAETPLTIIAATYDAESDAIADYDAAKELYSEWNIADSYDAAVIEKDPDGHVKILQRHEQPTLQAGGTGMFVGLALGAIAALFPAVGLGGGLLAGAAGGAIVGAITGHVVAGISRSDLKDLGKALNEGTWGMVIVASSDVSVRLDGALSHANHLVNRNLACDSKRLTQDVQQAISDAV
ncbi:hypothetical protein GCM10027589_30690 [Actinocorallia lasiicapitis]